MLSCNPRCEDRVLDGPASGEKGSKGGPYTLSQVGSSAMAFTLGSFRPMTTLVTGLVVCQLPRVQGYLAHKKQRPPRTLQ